MYDLLYRISHDTTSFYLTTNSNVDKIRDSGQLLYESPHLVHSASQQLVDIELLLVHPASNRSTHQHFTRTQSLPANTTSTLEQRPAVQVYPSKAIWRRLLSNQSSVFMHVLLVASSNTSHQGMVPPSPCLHLPLIHLPATAAVTLTYAQTPQRLPVW